MYNKCIILSRILRVNYPELECKAEAYIVHTYDVELNAIKYIHHLALTILIDGERDIIDPSFEIKNIKEAIYRDSINNVLINSNDIPKQIF